MDLVRQLRDFLDTIEVLGADALELRVDPPATEADIVEVEREIDLRIPGELRRSMLEISARLEFRWFLPDTFELPHELREIFCGDLHWGLDLTPAYVANHKGWIDTVFSDPTHPYCRIWYDKFPFHAVGNGDMLAIDASGRVVYLSHDDGEGHGYVMAESFGDLLERWVPLGCVGGEDWQWLPFTNDMNTRIAPTCANAVTWKTLVNYT